MALNSSGPISLAGTTAGQSIALELGLSTTGEISLNQSNVRSLAGIPSGAITMPTNFWGKSSFTPFLTYSNVSGSNFAWIASSGTFIGTGNAITLPTEQQFINFDPAGNITWARAYSLTGIYSLSQTIISGDGSRYIVGYITNTIVLIKYDSSGVLQWQKSYTDGVGIRPGVNGNCTDSAGNLYIGYGRAPNATTFNGVMKIDPSGNVLWAKTFSTVGNSLAAVNINPANTAIVISGGANSTTSPFQSAMVIADTNGNVLSTFNLAATGSYIGQVVLDNSNNIYVGVNTAVANAGASSSEMVKFNSAGVKQWGTTIIGNPGSMTVRFITGQNLSPDGNFYYCSFQFANYFNANWSNTLPNQVYLKVDSSNGAIQWQRAINGPTIGVEQSQSSGTRGMVSDDSGNLQINKAVAMYPRGFNVYGYPSYNFLASYFSYTAAELAAASKTYTGYGGLTLSLGTRSFGSGSATVSSTAYSPTVTSVTITGSATSYAEYAATTNWTRTTT